MTDLPQGPRSRHVDRAGVVIALALAALAAVLVWDSRQLQTTTMYGMGPEVMPVVIAIGLGRHAHIERAGIGAIATRVVRCASCSVIAVPDDSSADSSSAAP